MADKIGGIFIDLGLNTAAFSKGLTAAQGQVQKFGASTSTALGKIGKTAFGGLAQGTAGAVASLLTLGGAIAGARQALEKFGDIADKSAAAGIDPEFFQGIAHEASLSGVEIEGVAGALATFAKNSGLAADQKGKLYSTLKAINPELLRSIQLASSQEDRIRLAADAISQAKTAAEQAALATTLFGESGTKLVAVFKGGAAALDTMIAKAKDLGIVVERSLIEQADSLGDKLDTASQIVQTKLNVGFVALAPLIADSAGWAAELARLMGIAYEQTKAIEQRQFLNPLQNQLAATYTEMQPLKDRIAELKAELAKGQDFRLSIELEDSQTRLDGLLVTANQLLDRIQQLQGYKPPAPAGPPVDPREALFADMTGRGGSGRNKPVERFYPEAGTGGGKSDAQAAIDQAQAVLESLKSEQEQLGLNSQELAVYNALKAAGVTAGSAMGQEIVAATTALEAQRQALADNAAAMAEFGDLAKSATRGFIDDLAEGTSAAEAFGNVLGKLGDKLLDLGLNSIFGGGNNGSGLLGQVFGFADGGIAAHGRPVSLPRFAGGGVSKTASIFGEAGPEAAVPLPDGRRIPVDLSMPTGMRGSGTISAPITINIDAAGADPAAVARLQTTVATLKAELPSQVLKAVRAAKATGNLR